MTKIWVDLDIGDNYQIIAYRHSDGVMGTLKGASLRKAENVINLYRYCNIGYSGVYSEIEINEKDFVPVSEPLKVER